jgi:hypothetical protein
MKNKIIKGAILALSLLAIAGEAQAYRGSGRIDDPNNNKAIEVELEFCRGSRCSRGSGRRGVLWH